MITIQQNSNFIPNIRNKINKIIAMCIKNVIKTSAVKLWREKYQASGGPLAHANRLLPLLGFTTNYTT